jgi:predicted RNase H-like nuclease (RuvC/YqgF family)
MYSEVLKLDAAQRGAKEQVAQLQAAFEEQRTEYDEAFEALARERAEERAVLQQAKEVAAATAAENAQLKAELKAAREQIAQLSEKAGSEKKVVDKENGGLVAKALQLFSPQVSKKAKQTSTPRPSPLAMRNVAVQ